MTPSDSQPPRPAAFPDIEMHLQALTKLRWQMLELHARLEYLRLMLRLSARR